MNTRGRRPAHRARARGAALVSFMLLAGPTRPATAGTEGAVTNFALLRATARAAVAEMFEVSPPVAGAPLLVMPGMAHPHNWIVGELIGARLAELGVRVRIADVASGFEREPVAGAPRVSEESASMLLHLAAQKGAVVPVGAGADSTELEPASDARGIVLPPREGHVLEYRVGLSEVTYIDESRALLLGPKRVERGASVEVTCRIEDGETGELIWLGDGSATRVDAVPKSKLGVFESEGFAPERVSGGGVARLVEPVIVGGIVTGLVVLFYTNQN